jgi:hypothetical protein
MYVCLSAVSLLLLAVAAVVGAVEFMRCIDGDGIAALKRPLAA